MPSTKAKKPITTTGMDETGNSNELLKLPTRAYANNELQINTAPNRAKPISSVLQHHPQQMPPGVMVVYKSEQVLQVAISYIKRDFGVVLNYGINPNSIQCECSKGPQCPSAGKHPIGGKWQGGIRDEVTLRAKFKQYQNMHLNLGIATWQGLVVVDVDHRDGKLAD